MPSDCISYQESGYFTPLMNDYLDQKPNIQSLYNRFPSLENFKEQIIEKQQNYPVSFRGVLVSALQKQYKSIETSASTQQNIDALLKNNTFTITTGHQLNLFTGPLYFLYKIISTINLTEQLKVQYPESNFVPIYWMATEDHDFEEINYFTFKGKKIRWNKNSTGPVGRLSTKGLEDVFEVFTQELGVGKNADDIKRMFEEAYLAHDSLADATRHLANALFGQYGLVILDADSSDLKREFIPYIKEELLHQSASPLVLATTEKLQNYNIQVNPREINLFYIEDTLRERIILEGDHYLVNNTELRFSREEILELVEQHPEKFSPNVIMRPLYQEIILPNLCYIGGGGELAYWLELKSYFNHSDIPFPILLLRNSVLIATAKQALKADKLDLSWSDLFSKQQILLNRKTKELSEFPIDFSAQKEFLKKQFEALHEIAKKTDASFLGAVNAQEVKQIKGLEHLEKRLLRAQKRKLSDELNRITELQNELFPGQSLQERKDNFSEYYLETGPLLIENLMKELKPLENNFSIVIQ
ncbi:bacillithiol biosynthesis cysteine-adding enzyme BshC [Flavobacterium sp. '19STA2R22 D10 B1']|uniref:bacillithiol biosynthesis cysteine-adding enzyme BshC n=1 Tax=Flavobacterium aerium TaxID=3037261 RepID=UPI00278C846E|nr:bacillithiol biosynthesis cysteine-adding enzyme BshC [Flavobacterium sp. '19STA2R22 D10 B1']